jgi:DNA-binding protein HU-beta
LRRPVKDVCRPPGSWRLEKLSFSVNHFSEGAQDMAEAKPMTKSQIMTSVAEASGVTKKDAVAVIEALIALAYKEAKRNPKGITIPGLGKLIKVQRTARWGRNPATGEKIKIKAKKALKFRIAKAAKDAVL